MDKIINVGLIGAGRIAGHHLRAISNYKTFKVKAIADLNSKKKKCIQKNLI